MNYSININSNFRNKPKFKKGLTPQEEYWLDRILRNHSGQIYSVVILFFVMIIATFIFAILNKSGVGYSTEFSVIRINP